MHFYSETLRLHLPGEGNNFQGRRKAKKGQINGITPFLEGELVASGSRVPAACHRPVNLEACRAFQLGESENRQIAKAAEGCTCQKTLPAGCAHVSHGGILTCVKDFNDGGLVSLWPSLTFLIVGIKVPVGVQHHGSLCKRRD